MSVDTNYWRPIFVEVKVVTKQVNILIAAFAHFIPDCTNSFSKTLLVVSNVLGNVRHFLFEYLS